MNKKLVPKKIHRVKPKLLALEQRMMFDGAAIATHDIVDVGQVDVTQDIFEKVVDSNYQHTATPVEGYSTNQKELVFIDESILDIGILDLLKRSDIEVVKLSSSSNQLNQIDAYLNGRNDLTAIHIVTHGREAEIALGSINLNSDNLQDYSTTFANIGSRLGSDGDILFYACNVAAATTGQNFIQGIAELSNADVSSSIDSTGSAFNRDWTLEFTTGQVVSELFEVSASINLELGSFYGTLSSTDLRNNLRGNYAYDAYTISGIANGTVIGIGLNANGMSDPFLQVVNSAGGIVAQNDDYYGLNSYIPSIAWQSSYHIRATSYSGSTGGYYLYTTAGDLVPGSVAVNTAPSVTSSATYTVNENSTSVGTATATDPEGNAITYSVSGTDAALFSINSSNGVITFRSAPNFESPSDSGANNVYNFRVTATDSGGLSGFRDVAVTVVNVNESPTLTVPASFSLTEDITGNLQFSGSPFADVDGNNLTVTLSVPNGSINASSTATVSVGGTATARTFSGSAANLNTYFATSGNVTYSPVSNANGSRTLTVSVSDG